jgi:hypothetical protein
LQPTDRDETARVEWVPIDTVAELAMKGELLASGRSSTTADEFRAALSAADRPLAHPETDQALLRM